MYCEVDKKECKALFCRNKCIHELRRENKASSTIQATMDLVLEGMQCLESSSKCHSSNCISKGVCLKLKEKYTTANTILSKKPKKKFKPYTMKGKTEEEKVEIVFAERLKRSGDCQKCGHYKPCLFRCYKPIKTI